MPRNLPLRLLEATGSSEAHGVAQSLLAGSANVSGAVLASDGGESAFWGALCARGDLRQRLFSAKAHAPYGPAVATPDHENTSALMKGLGGVSNMDAVTEVGAVSEGALVVAVAFHRQVDPAFPDR